MTTNEMILKTLTTKVTKEPKYKSILEDMGFTIYDSGCSHYNYWAIKCEATGQTLVISRDRGNRRGLFDPYNLIKYDNKENDISKIDFVGYLRTTRYMSDRTPKESEYKKLRKEIKYCKGWNYEYHKKELDETYKEIDKLYQKLKYHNERIKEYEDKLTKARKRVKELKINK